MDPPPCRKNAISPSTAAATGARHGRRFARVSGASPMSFTTVSRDILLHDAMSATDSLNQRIVDLERAFVVESSRLASAAEVKSRSRGAARLRMNFARDRVERLAIELSQAVVGWAASLELAADDRFQQRVGAAAGMA